MTRHLLLLLPTTRIFMSSVVAAGLVSTSSIGAARENNVFNICPGRAIAWRLPRSQNQLADCPERGALPTIVMARNANGGGIRNCCQSCELLDAGKPSDGQAARIVTKRNVTVEKVPSIQPPGVLKDIFATADFGSLCTAVGVTVVTTQW